MDELIFKTFAIDAQPIPDSRQIKFLISTGSVDRDGDTINPKGWQLDHYKRSPVVLWSHDYTQMPIAKAVAVEASDNGLAATAEFPPKGAYPFADTVYDMLKGGFLSATSVGFRPVEYETAKDRQHGNNFLKQELLEFSVVPVPANPEALMQRGISSEQADTWKAYIKKEWVEPKLSPWDIKCQEFEARFKDAADWTGDKKDAFLADVKIESENGTHAIGEARLQTLLKLNKLSSLMTKQMPVPDKGETERAYLVRALGEGNSLTQYFDQYDAYRKAEPDVLDLDEDYTLEVADDLVEVDEAGLLTTVAATVRDALAQMATEAAMRAINRARGVVQ